MDNNQSKIYRINNKIAILIISVLILLLLLSCIGVFQKGTIANRIMCAIMIGVFAYSIGAVNRALLRVKYITIADNKLRAYHSDDQFDEYFIPNSIKKVEVVDKGVVHIHLDNGSQQFGLNTALFCDRAELEAELERIIPTVTINKDKTMERVSLFKAEPNKDLNTGVLTKGTGKDIPEIDRSQENKGKLGA